MNILVTEKAKKQLTQLGVNGDQFLRISVIQGGCSGMTYNAGIEENMADDDQVVFQDEGIKVVADMGSALYMEGLEVDYSEDLIQSGFRFKNLHAVHSCGCGSSFAL